VRVRNAELKSTGSGRPTVPAWMLAPFALAKDGRLSGVLAPLSWKKALHLPPERSLEAWYFSPTGDAGDWIIDPREVLVSDGGQPDLASFIFEAEIIPDAGKHRLVAKGLLTDLGERSGKLVWIVAEPQSFSVWTDAALQIWHHYLTT
jgi:hypothetical protein